MRAVGATCIVVVSLILIAGLWPFHVPHNNVSWIKIANGLRFGGHGMAISLGILDREVGGEEAPCSLEIRLVPQQVPAYGTILAFDSSPDPRLPLALRQHGASLTIQRYVTDLDGGVRYPWIKIDDTFRKGESVLLAITSTKLGTRVYSNGRLAGMFSEQAMSRNDLVGRFVLASSTVDDSWRGDISALAIYDRELTPTEVSRHFDSWTLNHQPDLNVALQPLALFLFNERTGWSVRNRVNGGVDLSIPHNYSVLHPALLNPVWVQYSHQGAFWGRWSFWKDVIINIAGFVPFGFTLLMYLSSVTPPAGRTAKAILLGFCLSLSIEVIQRFLPTRDSGMMDLVTNTIGTIGGAFLYRSQTIRNELARLAEALPADFLKGEFRTCFASQVKDPALFA